MDKTNNKDNTNTLEKLIEETDYSAGEWAVFRKVEKNNQLQDFLKDYKYYGIYPVKEYNLNNLPEKNKFVKELNQLTLEEDEE